MSLRVLFQPSFAWLTTDGSLLCHPKVLISRDYRGDLEAGIIDRFLPLVMDSEDEGVPVPIVQYEDTTFLYVKHNNLYLVAATRKNANAALVFVFLHKLVEVFIDYFKVLEEESIRDNFVIIYEVEGCFSKYLLSLLFLIVQLTHGCSICLIIALG